MPIPYDPLSVQEIAPGVRRLVAPNPGMMTGAGTNTYVLGVSRHVVIDAGPAIEEHLQRILAATRSCIDAVLVTHAHKDHSPGARVLAQRTGATLLGSQPPADGRQDTTFVPERVLQDGSTVAVETRRLRAIHTPGHVSNHLCYLLEDSGMLFTGDHLNQGTTVVILPPDGSMSDYLKSLERLKHESIGQLAPGHGGVIENGLLEIDRIIKHRLAREAKVLERLGSFADSVSLDELVVPVYDDVQPQLHAIAKQSLWAHLIKLELDGRVEQVQPDHWKLRMSS